MANQENQVVLNKTTFEEKYAADMGVTKKHAGEVYDKVFGYVRETMKAEGKVRLPGVGVLYVDDLKAREYTKPCTNIKVEKGERKRYKLSAKPFEA